MDIYKFINSQDIRAYLKQVDYQFSSLETAWLIWKSKYTTLGEKHDAWREVIETMPDCEIEERANTAPQPSLHHFLERLMEIENMYIEEIQQEDNRAFYLCGFETEDGVRDRVPPLTLINRKPSFWQCFDMSVDYCKEQIKSNDLSTCIIWIKKHYFDTCDKKERREINIEMSAEREILTVTSDDFKSIEERNTMEHGFDGMRLLFPTPFEVGDIIYNPGRLSHSDFECNYGSCVLLSTVKESYERIAPNNGDSSDMIIEGLFLGGDGTVYNEVSANYMNYEYYRGKFSGKQRVLQILSKYLKQEISLDTMLSRYYKYISKGRTDAESRWENVIKKLKLAGILEEKCNE